MPDEEAEGKSLGQDVRLEPPEAVGPFFPSGMSAPEAAVAGADANLTDDQKARLRGEAPADTAVEEE